MKVNIEKTSQMGMLVRKFKLNRAFGFLVLGFTFTFCFYSMAVVNRVSVTVHVDLPSSVSGITWQKTSLSAEMELEKDKNKTKVTDQFRFVSLKNEKYHYSTTKSCPVSFRATIRSMLLQQLGTVEMDVEIPWQWMDSRDRVMDQKNEIRITLMNDILSWGFLLPGTYILLLNPENAQFGVNVSHVQAHNLLSCTHRDSQGYIPFFAKVTSTPVIEDEVHVDFHPSLVKDLFIYLANCRTHNATTKDPKTEISPALYKPKLITFRPSHCFQPRRKGTYNDTNKLQNTVLVPFTKDVLCNFPRSIIKQFRFMFDTAASISSIGTILKREMGIYDEYFSGGENDNWLYAEIDARMTNLLGEYDYHCWKVTDDVFIKPSTHEMLQTTPIKKLRFTPKGNYIRAEYINGKIVHFKYIGVSPERPHSPSYFNQGCAELVGHYVDRVLGTYLTPTSVYRKVPLAPSCEENPDVCKNNYDYTKFNISGMVGYDPAIIYSKNMMMQARKDSSGYYIDYTVVGWVKDIGQMNREHIFEPLTSEKMWIRKYFQHTITQYDMLKYNTSRQDLLDISDVLLFNFLVHDWDHAWLDNWVKSGTRFISFDNGLGFDPSYPGPVCEVQLHCPYFFCHISGSKHSCNVTNETKPFCRFNKDTVIRLQRLGPEAEAKNRLGARIREIVTKEPWYSKEFAPYFGEEEIGVGLDERVAFALDYIKGCEKRHGESVYI